jgi:geranylgeranyl reductase family protein
MSADYEAIIVGGGPAGSTIGASLAEAGHRVLILDKSRFPRDKACSDYINPAAAQMLSDMGVLDDALHLGARWMDGMIVHSPSGNSFTANYAKAEPGRAALGLSRKQLDHLLLERAKALGASVIERAHARAIIRRGGTVSGVEATINGVRQSIVAPLVIGADGRNSIVRRDLDLESVLRWPRKTGLVAHYRDVNDLDRFGEMHIGRGVYAGLATIEDGLTNLTVVASSRDIEQRSGSVESFFSQAMQRLPEMNRKLEGATRVDGIRGVGAMGCRTRRVVGDGFLLVGDAASFLDPFAGEGVYEAMRGALLAAPVVSSALMEGEHSSRVLEPYRVARRREFAAKRAVSWIVQGFINTPRAMDYVTTRLAKREELGLVLSGVLGNFQPAGRALSPLFLARLLRP